MSYLFRYTYYAHYLHGRVHRTRTSQNWKTELPNLRVVIKLDTLQCSYNEPVFSVFTWQKSRNFYCIIHLPQVVNVSLIFRWSLSQPPIRKLSTQPLLWHRNWQHVPWQILNIHRSLPEHPPVLQDAESSLLSCHINTVPNQTDDTFQKKLPVYLTYRYIKQFLFTQANIDPNTF